MVALDRKASSQNGKGRHEKSDLFFKLIDGVPVPQFRFEPDGSERKADGVKLLTLKQTMEKTDLKETTLRTMYRAVLADLLPGFEIKMDEANQSDDGEHVRSSNAPRVKVAPPSAPQRVEAATALVSLRAASNPYGAHLLAVVKALEFVASHWESFLNLIPYHAQDEVLEFTTTRMEIYDALQKPKMLILSVLPTIEMPVANLNEATYLAESEKHLGDDTHFPLDSLLRVVREFENASQQQDQVQKNQQQAA